MKNVVCTVNITEYVYLYIYYVNLYIHMQGRLQRDIAEDNPEDMTGLWCFPPSKRRVVFPMRQL